MVRPGLPRWPDPAGSLRSESFGGQTTDEEPQPPRPVTLHDTELEWTGGNLLDLAIGADLDAPFSCRVGAVVFDAPAADPRLTGAARP
ncbi:MAG: hypothetical protein AAFX99_33675, partial [Myxococcota bacterium]